LYADFDVLLASLKESGSQQSTVSSQPQETGEPPTAENEPQPTESEQQAASNEQPANDGEQRTANSEQPAKSVVRVSLEKLDDLVKIVGGLVISRSVFERRLAELEQQIGEIHNSTRRLQHSTNKLETEFEASTLNAGVIQDGETGRRREREYAVFASKKVSPSPRLPVSPSQFDSLELDRYTDFHQTMRELIETTSDTAAINTELDNLHGNLELLFENQRRLIEEMQDKLLRLRLVSFGSLSIRLQRTVRVTCDEEGKSAELKIEGENLEVDTQILDSLIEPLLHLLRNAVAHGIEPPEMRRLLGKPETGQISVRVKSEGTHIILKISDDGRGIFADGLKEKAVRDNFITERQAAAMSDEEAFSLIFLAGLTTAERISQVSGRGVGMNIVKQNIERQQGTISIASETQQGTTFTVRLPMALAVTRVLLVKANEQIFALPLKIVKHISQKSLVGNLWSNAEGASLVNKNDEQSPIFHLNELLGLPSAADEADAPLLLLKTPENPCALIIDEIVKAEEVVIKPLGNPLQNMAEILGATILGDGSVVPVLDLIYLLKQKVQSPKSKVQNKEESRIQKPHLENANSALRVPRSALKVLIVDDSPSVRHLTSNIIKNAGWTALLAKDGLDALEILQDSRELPDVILSDVEMPRMDGYEFLASLKRAENLQAIPVVMITSRANQKHQQKAFDLGVSEYLTKPFDEAKLIGIIKNLAA
ncbi:MAG: hybrid sensor histidine kinase/response regulator, partial [Pyrinomonadaceae bacterium]